MILVCACSPVDKCQRLYTSRRVHIGRALLSMRPYSICMHVLSSGAAMCVYEHATILKAPSGNSGNPSLSCIKEEVLGVLMPREASKTGESLHVLVHTYVTAVNQNSAT